MTDDEIRAQLVDLVARIEIPRVVPVNGRIAVSAESMADAMLPTIRDLLDQARRDGRVQGAHASLAALDGHGFNNTAHDCVRRVIADLQADRG